MTRSKISGFLALACGVFWVLAGCSGISDQPIPVGPFDDQYSQLDIALDGNTDTWWPEVTDDPKAHWRKPCDGPENCAGEVCIPDEKGTKVCSWECDKTSDCLGDWECNDTSEDGVSVCSPPLMSWCVPCKSDADCVYENSRCIHVGTSGKFCGIDCWKDLGACPSHSKCVEAELDATGPGSMQCIPDTESCICTFEVNGTSRECYVTNPFGKCKGSQTCNGSDGWTVCDGPTPEKEICDGLDNNCNDRIDDEIELATCEWKKEGVGTCKGMQVCQGTKGLVCDAQEPKVEVCDGFDNDCDGVTDEDFPDTDGDKTLDCLDDDDDDDGLHDDEDNCPLDKNPEQEDLDLDEVGDACDPDIDGDGHNNDKDCRPYDKLSNPNAKELCDGLDNDCDSVVDEIFLDSDFDEIADCVDPDDDDDGDPDETDCEPYNYKVFHGASELCDAKDNNCDGYADEGCGPTAVSLQSVSAVVRGQSFSIKANIIIGGLVGSSIVSDGKVKLQIGIRP